MMLLIEVHQRRVNHQRSSSIQQSWLQTSSLTRRVPLKDMTSDLRDQSYNEALAMMTKRQLQALELIKRPELTCISEEGMLDLPDNILDELEYFDINDCMTSCDQVENYLMLSEYENNLNKTHELHMLKGQAPKKRSVVRGLTRKFLPPGSSQSLQDKGQLPSMADSTSIIRPSSTEVSQVVTNIAKATSV